ncbi:hypothetical protein LCGC14_2279670 [marine sediment metagenome]|uniref:Major capsid protein n=1 Tax=marine sediment metagenome TaxID=412755 RepID=A0A0F9F6Y3_9ZZZZ
MTVTTWSSDTAVERWVSAFMVEAGPAEFMEKFIGDDETHFLQRKRTLENQKGKSVHIDLITEIPQSSGGVTGDNTRAGNEVPLINFEQEMTLDALWQGTLSKGPLQTQQQLYDFRKLSLRGLGEWFRVNKDIDLVTVLSASPTRTLSADDGGVPVIDSGSKANLIAADKITVADIRLLKALAKKPYTSGHPRIKPVMIDGERFYILLITTESWVDLQADSEYQQLFRDAHVRGSKNPLFRDAKTIINNVLVHEYENIQTFDDGGGASVHGSLNLFLGAQAAVILQTKKGDNMMWHEETVDRGKQLSIGGTQIFEIAKTNFNSIDQSVIAYYTSSTDLSA